MRRAPFLAALFVPLAAAALAGAAAADTRSGLDAAIATAARAPYALPPSGMTPASPALDAPIAPAPPERPAAPVGSGADATNSPSDLPAAAAASPHSASDQGIEMVLPLILNGFALGDFSVVVTTSGRAFFPRDALFSSIAPKLTKAAAARFRALPPTDGRLSLEQLRSLGWTANLDMVALNVDIRPTPADLDVVRYDFSISDYPLATRSYLKPARLAAAVDLYGTAAQTESRADGSVSQGFVSANGYVNVLGTRGVTFPVRATNVSSSDGRSTTRVDPFRVVHDVPDRPLRITAGTMDPQSGQFGAMPTFRGLSVETAYAALQPTRSLVPSGSAALTIDQPSTVEIEVNGVLERTLKLEPGRYALKSLTSKAGLSAVKVFVTDMSGRRLEQSFPVFADGLFLDSSVREYGVYIGAPVESDSSAIAVSGWSRFNVRPDVALEVQGSSYRGNVHGQANATTRIPGGLARVGLAASRFGNTLGVQALGQASRQFDLPGAPGAPAAWRPVMVNASLTMASPRYSPDVFGPSPQRAPLVAASLSASQQFRDWAWSAQTYHRSAVRGSPRQTMITLAANRTLAGWFAASISVSVDAERRKAVALPGIRLLISRTARWRQLDATATTENAQLSWRGDVIKSSTAIFRPSAQFNADREGYTASTSGRLQTNRFETTGVLSSSSRGNQGDTRTVGASFRTGLAFAGGAFAWGSSPGEAFAIVTRADPLRRAEVRLDGDDGGPTPRTGLLGPALVGLFPHAPQAIALAVDKAPDGYAATNAPQFLKPGYGVGYRISVGSKNWRSVVGTLVSKEGPVASARLSIVNLDDPKLPPLLSFTNSGGRFFSEGIAEARYAIQIGGATVARFSVAKGAPGIVDVGELNIDAQ